MSMSPDPGEVLRHLADCLDVDRTLEAFPGMTRKEIRSLLIKVAESFPAEVGPAVLWVDGAARGNPGQAGAGIVLDKGEENIYRLGEFLGEATNNEAEYRALIRGLDFAGRQGCTELEVRSDSELMVRQMKGEYKVKNPRLQELYFQAVKAMKPFKTVIFRHVARERNRDADRLANMAIDSKGKVSL
jgi:ribonuclease HI